MKQTAVQWLKKTLEDYGSPFALDIDWNVFDKIIEQAIEMERDQIGYTKEDVLKAGEMGEINHHDYKHIVSLLDEARELNNKQSIINVTL